MRAKLICTPMILLLLAVSLCGCGRADSENTQALQLRSDFLAMTGCSGSMDLTADYGRRVYHYAVSFSGSPQDGLKLVLTAPEEVAGITAAIENGQTALTYDDVRLETGPLNEDGLSPLDALPAMLREMRTGYIAEIGSEPLDERETLRICFRDPAREAGQGTEVILWFGQEDNTLLRGVVRSDGAAVIQCSFSSFVLTKPTTEKG